MASLTVLSYAEIVLATVPEAPPTRKNQRPTSWPAPISANVPYLVASRLMWRALWPVSVISWSSILGIAISQRANQILAHYLKRFCIASPAGKWAPTLRLRDFLAHEIGGTP